MTDSLSEIKAALAGLDSRIQGIATQQAVILSGIQTVIDLHPRLSALDARLGSIETNLTGLKDSGSSSAETQPQIDGLNADVLKLTGIINKLNEPTGGYALDARFESISKSLSALQDTVAGFAADIASLKTENASMKTMIHNYSAGHRALAAVLSGLTPSGSGSQTPAPTSPKGSSTPPTLPAVSNPPGPASTEQPANSVDSATSEPPAPTVEPTAEPTAEPQSSESSPPQPSVPEPTSNPQTETPADVNQTPILQIVEVENLYLQPASSPKHGATPVPTIN